MNGIDREADRKKLSRPAKEVLTYTMILVVCYGMFWLGLGRAVMFYGLFVQYFLLPSANFVVALLMGLDKTWKERQWWMLLYFGFGYFLMQYGTFDLANMISTGSFHLPQDGLFTNGVLFALPGMALGSVIRWGREFCAHPGDPRRPLWAFGMVWSIGVVVQHLLILVPIVAALPLSLLGPTGVTLNGEAISQVATVVYFVGSCGVTQLAAVLVGFLLGRSFQWTRRQKLRLLPWFGVASMLSVGIGSFQVSVPWLQNILFVTASLYLGILPVALVAFMLGMIAPALGVLVGKVMAPKRMNSFPH